MGVPVETRNDRDAQTMSRKSNADRLVEAATEGGWTIVRLPVGSVRMLHPERGRQDECFRFTRANSKVEAATLVGETDHQHPDAFWLHNGAGGEPRCVEYLYEMLGTLTSPADADGYATVPPKDPTRMRR
jgi:hypothetical protein